MPRWSASRHSLSRAGDMTCPIRSTSAARPLRACSRPLHRHPHHHLRLHACRRSPRHHTSHPQHGSPEPKLGRRCCAPHRDVGAGHDAGLVQDVREHDRALLRRPKPDRDSYSGCADVWRVPTAGVPTPGEGSYSWPADARRDSYSGCADVWGRLRQLRQLRPSAPVSYTHLTLPTILLV